VNFYERTKNLQDELVRARLRVTPNQGNPTPMEQDDRPGSPTLHMLEDLELESRGMNDYFSLHYEQEETSSEPLDLFPQEEETGEK